MATAVRHPILYDVDRWRRYRTWLLLPATVCAMTALLTSLLHPSSGSAFVYAVVSAALFAIATSLWTRQRFSYLARDGDSLVVRAGVRCVIDDLLVVPVADADRLLAELLEHVCPQRAVTPATSRRRRRRR